MRSFTIGTIVFCAAIVISTAFPPGRKPGGQPPLPLNGTFPFPPKDSHGNHGFELRGDDYPKEPDHTEGPDSTEDHTGLPFGIRPKRHLREDHTEVPDSREDHTEGPGSREDGHFKRRPKRHERGDHTEGPDSREDHTGSSFERRGGKKNHGK